MSAEEAEVPTPQQARGRLAAAFRRHPEDAAKILAAQRDLDYANIAASIERRAGGVFTPSQRSTLYSLIRSSGKAAGA